MLDKSEKELRGTFGKFATGVAAITFVSSKGLKLGITINSYTSLSLNPPMILWCLDKVSDPVSYTHLTLPTILLV